MAYKTPTSRKTNKKQERINLIPILDAVFIFIFFLLMSTQFVKIFEIGSDVPIVSNEPPPKMDKKPLALTVTIKSSGFEIATGLPSRTIQRIAKNSEGQYNLDALHAFLVDLKKKNMDEKAIILEPIVDLDYEEIIKIMDSVRKVSNTDDVLYKKDKDGVDVIVKELFSQIIFGNLMN